MFKRYFLPPLAPSLLLVLISMWIIFDESNGPPRIIDGQPDDAPRFAALFVLILSPLFYLGFAALNLLDSAFDRMERRAPWVMTSVLTICTTTMMFRIFYQPGVDTAASPSLGAALVVAAGSLWPMTLLRRLVPRGGGKQSAGTRRDGGC